MPAISVRASDGTPTTVNTLPPVGATDKNNALPFTIATNDPILAALAALLQAGGNIGSITGAVSLPTGAATLAAQTTGNTSLGSAVTALGSILTTLQDTSTPSPVTGPSGAALATAAKQPALGTAGTAATDVISVQGIANGVAQASDTVVKATATNRSGTITAGGTAQQLMPANTLRRGFVLQNNSAGPLYVNGLGSATSDGQSLTIPAGALYPTDPHHVGTGAISILGATTGQTFYCREF